MALYDKEPIRKYYPQDGDFREELRDPWRKKNCNYLRDEFNRPFEAKILT